MNTGLRFESLLVGLVAAGFAACTGPDSAGAAEGSEPSATRTTAAVVSEPPTAARGRTLFDLQCAVCHGPQGDGRGQAAYLLSPLPRDFGSGRFRLVSTQNSVPSDADLVAVMRRGMPGSAMPAFEWLRDDELASLALYVRELARAGIVRGLRDYAEQEGEDFDEAEALEIAEQRMAPGAPVELGDAPPVTDALLARGQEVYQVSCSACHGPDGRARQVDVQWNEDGTPTRPRDFTAGIFKGRATRADIVTRLRCGLPGSPMPSTELADPQDAWALASYVISLVRPGVEERVLQARRTVVARRVPALPEEADAPEWQRIEPVWLALMPLWWRDERIEGIELRALHDGKRIAFQLTWKDPSRDEELLGTETFSDMAGLQLSADANPPLFTMGEAGRPVNLLTWKAAWAREGPTPRNVVDRYPNMAADLHGYQPEQAAPLFLTARAAGNPVASAHRCCAGEELSAQGFGTLAPLEQERVTLDVQSTWHDGTWRVVLSRDMQSGGPEVVPLAAGSATFLAAAVWDGSSSDRNGQKSVSTWQVLRIER